MHIHGDLAADNLGRKKSKLQFVPGMGVTGPTKFGQHSNIDRQLFQALPNDALLQSFAVLQLAAGKFPQERQRVVVRPLTDQILLFAAKDRRRNLNQQFIPPPVCWFSSGILLESASAASM